VNDEELEQVVRRAITAVAPDVDAEAVGRDDDLRDTVGFDSMDVLNLAVALHEETGVDVPERDYGRIVTLAGCVSYLRSRIRGVAT
jgi:acyl carrier protein